MIQTTASRRPPPANTTSTRNASTATSAETRHPTTSHARTRTDTRSSTNNRRTKRSVYSVKRRSPPAPSKPSAATAERASGNLSIINGVVESFLPRKSESGPAHFEKRKTVHANHSWWEFLSSEFMFLRSWKNIKGRIANAKLTRPDYPPLSSPRSQACRLPTDPKFPPPSFSQ